MKTCKLQKKYQENKAVKRTLSRSLLIFNDVKLISFLILISILMIQNLNKTSINHNVGHGGCTRQKEPSEQPTTRNHTESKLVNALAHFMESLSSLVYHQI
jgi:hypothetical protein